ncbi:MAG: ribonuclease HII [Bifidobacteriaceae bacterium]|jgi:ribonuclease HII|nr:ribonuclease HII [Bifidobacteriaceae bacterium]
MRPVPTLDLETRLLTRAPLVVGMDEVGRGALAGPVAVGAVAVGPAQIDQGAPAGLADSKLLTARARERLTAPAAAWAAAWAVGWASAQEIDQVGIVGALRRAGRRALAHIAGPAAPSAPPSDRAASGDSAPPAGRPASDASRPAPPPAVGDGQADVRDGIVLLDGSQDWLSDPPADLFDPARGDPPLLARGVVTRVKADQACAAVAAASVLAKTRRDAHMAHLAELHPGYGWEGNKGYGTAAHKAAIGRLGPSPEHRWTWRL